MTRLPPLALLSVVVSMKSIDAPLPSILMSPGPLPAALSTTSPAPISMESDTPSASSSSVPFHVTLSSVPSCGRKVAALLKSTVPPDRSPLMFSVPALTLMVLPSVNTAPSAMKKSALAAPMLMIAAASASDTATV